MKPRLILTTRGIREIQNRFGIANLFNMQNEVEKLTVDLFCAVYFEGSRKWECPPSLEEVEDLPIDELMESFKAAFSDEKGGKPEAG